MPAYVVFIKEEVIDQSELDAYSAKVSASFKDREVDSSQPMELSKRWKVRRSKVPSSSSFQIAKLLAHGTGAKNIRRRPRYRGFIVDGRDG